MKRVTKLTPARLIKWREYACYWSTARIREEFRSRGRRSVTLVEFARCNDVSAIDRLWILLREEVLTRRELREFAVWNARRALGRARKVGCAPDARLRNAIRVAARFARGAATKAELSAAKSAAESAQSEAAWGSAAWLAARLAAWSAAESAAEAAAEASATASEFERQQQVRGFIRVLENRERNGGATNRAAKGGER